MIAEILEAHLEVLTEFVERREPVPAQMIENVKLAVSLVEDIPDDKLNSFLNALAKVPTK